MTTFPGEELRERREAMQLSIDEVYRSLRIPPAVLKTLEEGPLEALPPATYAEGFLATYCEFLQLDADSYVDCLRDCLRPPPGFLGMPSWEEPKPKWFSDALTWVAVCALLVLGWVAYTVVVHSTADETQVPVQAETIELGFPDRSE